MVSNKILLQAGVCASLILLAVAPAQATEFCEIVKTRDGFVALRAAPNPGARLLARMRPQDEVQLSGAPRGQWQRVIFWKDGDRLGKGYDKHTAIGWVNRALIKDCG